jgi:hypothetical protein
MRVEMFGELALDLGGVGGRKRALRLGVSPALERGVQEVSERTRIELAAAISAWRQALGLLPQ